MAKWLYDPRPPPPYPYIRATAAYSAAVTMVCAVRQLPTAAGMKEKGQGENTQCRMGCDAIEDTHHIFTACKTFDKLRARCMSRDSGKDETENRSDWTGGGPVYEPPKNS